MADSAPGSSDALTVRFEFSAEEYSRALDQAGAHGHRAGWMRRIWAFPLAFAASGLVAWLMNLFPAHQALVFSALWGLIAGLFWLMLRGPGFEWLLSRQRVDRPEERSFSSAGLDVAGGLDAAYIPWSRVTKVVETTEFLLVFSEGRLDYVPLGAVSDQARGRIAALLHRHASHASLRTLAPGP